MRRYFLVPENRVGNSVALPADIQQKVSEYNDAKNQMYNVPPHIRPQPLVKYEAEKWSHTQHLDDSATTTVAQESEVSEVDVEKLPKYARPKAENIMLYWKPVLAQLPEGVKETTLIRDLVTKRQHKVVPPILLKSVVKYLLAQPGFQQKWLDPTLLEMLKPREMPRGDIKKKKSKKRKSGGQDSRSTEPPTTTDDGEASPAPPQLRLFTTPAENRATNPQRSGQSSDVPATVVKNNTWRKNAPDIASKPSWT